MMFERQIGFTWERSIVTLGSLTRSMVKVIKPDRSHTQKKARTEERVTNNHSLFFFLFNFFD